MGVKSFLTIATLFFVTELFGQTWNMQQGNWLSPVNKNIGCQKSIQIGDNVGLDTARVNAVGFVNNRLGVGIFPTARFNVVSGSGGHSQYVYVSDSFIQLSVYDSSSAVRYLSTLNSYSDTWSVTRDSAATVGDYSFSITPGSGVNVTSGTNVLKLKNNFQIDIASAVTGYVLTATSNDGLATWQEAPSGWLTVIEQSTSITGAVGNYYYYDVSGDSDTLTLPASPTDGDIIGVYLATTSTPNTLRIARNGNTIAGQANDVLLYINADYLILQYTTGDWMIVSNGIQIHTANMSRDAAQSIGSGGAPTVIAFDAEAWDYGGIASAAGDVFAIRRDGLYEICFTGGLTPATAASFYVYVYKDGTDIRQKLNYAPISTIQSGSFSTIESFVAGDSITIRYYQDGTGSVNTPTNYNKPRCTITEQ